MTDYVLREWRPDDIPQLLALEDARAAADGPLAVPASSPSNILADPDAVTLCAVDAVGAVLGAVYASPSGSATTLRGTVHHV